MLRFAPFALLLAGCATTAPNIAVDEPTEAVSGKVVKIADGDTITILAPGNEQVKVRLWGIDTPERKQAFGTKAKQFTSDLVFGKTVKVETKDTDQYGRTLGIVKVEGKNVNLEILKAGMGWWYKQYAKNATDFEAAEKQAREKRVGLWTDVDAIAPWEFRRSQRSR